MNDFLSRCVTIIGTGAEDRRRRGYKEAGCGGLFVGHRMLLSAFVSVYADLRGITARTTQDYLWVARQFEASGGPPLSGFSAEAINRHLAGLVERGCAPGSVRTRRTKLLVLWRAAYREGITELAPDADRVRQVRVPAPNPVGFTAAEMRRLVDHCEQQLRHPLVLVPVPAGDYLAALFLFLWDTGMRLGDALSMEFAWLTTGTVTWRQHKTGVWHRARLTPRTRAAIERIRVPERCLIWPRPNPNRTALYRLIKAAIAGAELRGTSKWIRRGVATDVYLSGGDPARALGHVPGSRVAYKHYVSQDAQLEVVSPTEL